MIHSVPSFLQNGWLVNRLQFHAASKVLTASLMAAITCVKVPAWAIGNHPSQCNSFSIAFQKHFFGGGGVVISSNFACWHFVSICDIKSLRWCYMMLHFCTCGQCCHHWSPTVGTSSCETSPEVDSFLKPRTLVVQPNPNTPTFLVWSPLQLRGEMCWVQG